MATKRGLNATKASLGFYEKVRISDEKEIERLLEMKANDNLPDDIIFSEYSEYEGVGSFYRINGTGLADADYQEYLMSEQTLMMRTIKNCCVLFATMFILYTTIQLVHVS